MALNDAAKNLMLTEFASSATHMALFDETQTEITGGTYARQALTWGTASSGAISITNQPSFDIPASTTVGDVRFFSALTGGTEYGIYDTVDETFSNAGTYTITSATVDLNK